MSQKPTGPSPFCEAIYFYYACGCRTPNPIFCCQPQPNVSSRQLRANNPCQHKTSSVVIAKLPHSCKAKLGKTEACHAEDPATREFVREVDTAERLDLAIIGIPHDEIDKAFPMRVDGEFTVGQVAIRYLIRRRENSPALPPDVTPSVLRSCAPASIPVPASLQNDMKVFQTSSDAVSNRLSDNTKEEATKHEGGNSEGANEFFDAEPLPRTAEYVVDESSSRAEHTVKPEEPESSTPVADYDDMMMFWALDDDKAVHQTAKTSGWGISSLLGKFSNRRS
ncbi:hypothetical protein F4859DRAFT_517809 [Xylaria cf. heliscus]|nr:hypothetical protein F4859DRAFT_517809 [Xylaria cf. heliscus]